MEKSIKNVQVPRPILFTKQHITSLEEDFRKIGLLPKHVNEARFLKDTESGLTIKDEPNTTVKNEKSLEAIHPDDLDRIKNKKPMQPAALMKMLDFSIENPEKDGKYGLYGSLVSHPDMPIGRIHQEVEKMLPVDQLPEQLKEKGINPKTYDKNNYYRRFAAVTGALLNPKTHSKTLDVISSIMPHLTNDRSKEMGLFDVLPDYIVRHQNLSDKTALKVAQHPLTHSTFIYKENTPRTVLQHIYNKMKNDPSSREWYRNSGNFLDLALHKNAPDEAVIDASREYLGANPEVGWHGERPLGGPIMNLHNKLLGIVNKRNTEVRPKLSRRNPNRLIPGVELQDLNEE